MSQEDMSGTDPGRMAQVEDSHLVHIGSLGRGTARPLCAGGWVQEYKNKLRTAEEAVRKVKSGDAVYYSGNAAEPYLLIEKLAERHEELTDVKLNHVLLLGDDPLSKPEMQGHFRHNSLFVGPADRAAVNEGRADYIPIFLHQIPRLYYDRIIPLDVALIHVSPPDGHGYMSLGVEVMASLAASQVAKTVVALVNDKMPRVLGTSSIHVRDVDVVVETSTDLPELPPRPASEVEMAIGRYAADLVEDGSTLQLGLGGIPDALLKYLEGKRDIGIHTEMVGDGLMRAVENGIITCRRKNYHPGKVCLTFALGTKALYDYIHDNPLFEGHPVDWNNNPFIIARNDNMVAINAALEVDLTGQVCSDSIGTRIYSGFGGQVDFIRGASHSRNGKPIIALPSTAKGGEISRIVPVLQEGAGVVTTRADVHYIITEYGVAHIFGKNRRQRCEALIDIAHPNFRDDLEAAAKKRRLLP